MLEQFIMPQAYTITAIVGALYNRCKACSPCLTAHHVSATIFVIGSVIIIAFVHILPYGTIIHTTPRPKTHNQNAEQEHISR